MANTTTRIAQTSYEAKRAYKKHGPHVPESELRRLERAVVLEERAARIQEQEGRRKVAKRKREERERKEQEIRKELGVGLATQLIGFSHSQAHMKSGMEAFLGFKQRAHEDKARELHEVEDLDKAVEEAEKEPWDEGSGEDVLADLLDEDYWLDDDLDDDTLLEAHDLTMSDNHEGVLEALPDLQPPSLPAAVQPLKPPVLNDDPEFSRIHGPTNRSIEDVLERLPEPLIELLSQDISTNTPYWNPTPTLLHLLNPAGLPPHRLRIKVGCIVVLLRDLNASSQLSKSSHLRVLRVEKERLECQVLDGQLEGTKTFLTRVPFAAKYRNEDQCLFQRTQFPICVSTDYTCPAPPQEILPFTFKLPSISGQPSKSTNGPRKLTRTSSREKRSSNPNPSFRMPGLPASKFAKSASTLKLDPPSIPSLLDGWVDFLDSGSQIARELSSDDSIVEANLQTPAEPSSTLVMEDFDFSLDDLRDLYDQPAPSSNSLVINATDKSHRPPNQPTSTLMSPQKLRDIPPAQPLMPPPPPRTFPQQPDLKRKISINQESTRSTKRPNIQQPKLITVTANFNPVMKPGGSFSEFGLSTQDVTSLLDDDGSILSSPEATA